MSTDTSGSGAAAGASGSGGPPGGGDDRGAGRKGAHAAAHQRSGGDSDVEEIVVGEGAARATKKAKTSASVAKVSVCSACARTAAPVRAHTPVRTRVALAAARRSCLTSHSTCPCRPSQAPRAPRSNVAHAVYTYACSHSCCGHHQYTRRPGCQLHVDTFTHVSCSSSCYAVVSGIGSRAVPKSSALYDDMRESVR
jgi:hypothetical protein